MNTIQSANVIVRKTNSIRKTNVKSITYTPPYIAHERWIAERCTIITEKETFYAWSTAATKCAIFLAKGRNLCCVYTTKNGKFETVQINGYNLSKETTS